MTEQLIPSPTFLGRLRRDTRGNTLAMMAAALIPLAGITGSAIDTARLYVIKVRLQQACDAGVLAGRRFMTDSNSTTLDTKSSDQATTFFNNNFRTNWMGTTNTVFTPSKTTDFQVAGTAKTDAPMTLMKIFGFGNTTLQVNCQARYDVPDVDVMFVLDTTGSMSCLPSDSDSACTTYVNNTGASTYTRPSDSAAANKSVPGYPGSTGYYVTEKGGSRIAAVRTAVLAFFDTLESSKNTSTNVRYGFVTYSSSVNAGQAILSLNPSYMIGGAGAGTNDVTYQSRYIDPNATSQYQVSSSSAYDTSNQAACAAWKATRNPAETSKQRYTFDTTSRAVVVTKAWDSGAAKCNVTTTTYGPLWTYGPATYDVSAYVNNTTADDPSKLDATTSSWQGCIEERPTTSGTTSFNSDSLPKDLDPNLVPTNDADTKWRPMWPEVIYGRNYAGGTYWWGSTSNVMGIQDDSSNSGLYSVVNGYFVGPKALSYHYYGNGTLVGSGMTVCGKPVRRLGSMNRTDVANYVSANGDFRAQGGTYHDIGMIWGVRMLSPNGPFAPDTAAWPGRQAPNRVLVFLTDGDMAPSIPTYGMYGVEYFDRRVTGGDYGNQKAYHNARLLAACAKAKTMNINIWTVSIAPAATSEMQQCATTGTQALYTQNGSDLEDKFKKIAQAVAKLRISQ